MIVVSDVKQHSGVEPDGERENRYEGCYYVCLITYGKCVYWINGEKAIAGKGDVIFIPQNIPFYWKSIPTVFYSKYAVTFRLYRQPGVPGLPLMDTAVPLHAKAGCYDWLHEKFKAIIGYWAERISYYEITASALLTEALSNWNRELDQGEITLDKHRLVEAMKRYMQENYRAKITKEQLAEAIRRSPGYAATLFRSVTGETISGYMHSLRVKTAKYMLEESRLTIAEISEYLGYSDVSYFCKIFKAHTGRPPSDRSFKRG